MANLQVNLTKKPDINYPAVNDVFQIKYGPFPNEDTLKEGDVVIENLYLSVDAAMRVWISGVKSYIDPVLPGDNMIGFVISKVLVSKSAKFQKGDIVSGFLNWIQYQAVSDKKLYLIKRGGDLDELSMLHYLGPLGISGLTAFVGFETIGKPKENETVVISAAAGSVGEVAIQLAKNYYKCKVIGIAGGQEKCNYVKKVLGAEECIDYKNENISDKLKEYCPNGVNVYFDNVGGSQLDDVLMHIVDQTRIVLCGAISTYNTQSKDEIYKIKNYPRLIIKRAIMQGFIYTDHPELFKQGQGIIAKMLKQGQMKVRYDIQNGLDEAPNGLQKLLQGRNNGKVVVRIFGQQKPKL